MPLFGAHLSIAGGTDKAALRARQLGADCLQLFVKSPSQWRFAALADEEVERFIQTRNVQTRNAERGTRNSRKQKIEETVSDNTSSASSVAGVPRLICFAHASYLVNLASPDDTLYERSRVCLLEELDRAERLGLDGLVLHPGAHMGSGEAAGLDRIAGALRWLHDQRPGRRVRILLENTAGAGSLLAGRMEHLEYLIKKCNPTREEVADAETLHPEIGDTGDLTVAARKGPSWLGVCIDTCHLFAAGYDVRTAAALDATLAQLDGAIGLDRVHVIHANDSQGDLGSHLDRHAAIGRGHLGREAFRLLVNHPALRSLPFILETPKEDERGREMDPVNLRVLRKLVAT
jgi:deoxyribonuclease-4